MPRDLFQMEEQGGRDLFQSSNIEPREYSTLEGLYGGAATTAKRGILGLEQMLSNAMYEGEELQAIKDELARRNQLNESEYSSISESSPISSFIGSGIGASALLAPTFAIPGGAPVASAGILKGIAAPLAARGAAEGALLGGMNYVPEGQNRAENAVMGAGLGAATAGTLGAGLGAGIKGYSAIRNIDPALFLSRFRGETPADQILKNLETAKGTETPLGHVIGNPQLMRFEENILPRIPGSGMSEAQQRVAGQLKNETQDILKSIGDTKLPEDMTKEQFFHHKLYGGTSAARERNSNLYNNVGGIAEAFNVDYVPNLNEINTANRVLQQAEKDKRLAKALDQDEVLKQELMNIVQGENRSMNPATGQVSSTPMARSFMDAHFERSNYLDKERALNWDERLIKNIYLDLAKAMTEDMTSAAKNSGVPELMQMYRLAADDYKKHILPLSQNKKLAQTQKRLPGLEGQEIIFPEEISEKIPGMIISGGPKNDYIGSINSFKKYLDNEGKSLLLQSHFRKAFDENGNVNPTQFLNTWNSLGARQKQKLFEHIPETVQKFEGLSELAKLNPKAFQTMFNPPTGQQTLDALIAAQILSAGATTGAAIGGIPGLLIGGAAALPASGAASRFITKVLTDEKIREKVVKKLLESGKKTKKPLDTQSAMNLSNEISRIIGRSEVEKRHEEGE